MSVYCDGMDAARRTAHGVRRTAASADWRRSAGRRSVTFATMSFSLKLPVSIRATANESSASSRESV